MFVMVAIAVCSTLQIFLLTKRVCSFHPLRPSVPRREELKKNVQPLGVFTQPPLLLLRQLRVILLRRRSVLPVVPLPHRTCDETEGQPHENFLIHVHALRCVRVKGANGSVSQTFFIGFPLLPTRVSPVSRPRDEKKTTRRIASTRIARPVDVDPNDASSILYFSIVF